MINKKYLNEPLLLRSTPDNQVITLKVDPPKQAHHTSYEKMACALEQAVNAKIAESLNTKEIKDLQASLHQAGRCTPCCVSILMFGLSSLTLSTMIISAVYNFIPGLPISGGMMIIGLIGNAHKEDISEYFNVKEQQKIRNRLNSATQRATFFADHPTTNSDYNFNGLDNLVDNYTFGP